MNRRRFLFSSTASLGLFATTPSQSLTPPPATNVPRLSSALMQGLHEEFLRLMTRAMQGRTTAQDFRDASLWYGMVGENFKETNFDDFIRPVASKALSQIEMTGAPLDGSALESQISKELSARVGWDVTGEVHNIIERYQPDETTALKQIQEQGISQSFLDLSAGFAQFAETRPASMPLNREKPRLLMAAFSGGQSTPTYPPPAPRPPLISFCKVLKVAGSLGMGTAFSNWLIQGCEWGAVATDGLSCVDLLAVFLTGGFAYLATESNC